MNLKEKFNEVKEHISEVNKLNEAISLVYWDMRTSMPSKAGETRSDVISYLSGEVFKKTTSDKVLGFIESLNVNKEKMNTLELRMLEELEKDYNETKKIPEDRYVAYISATNKAEIAWEKAKENNDYEGFKDNLKEIINFQKEFIEYWGYEENKYDTLLDKYESGLTVKKLDKVFSELRDGIIEILKNIKSSNKKINREFLNGHFDTNKQKELSLEILKSIGFDLNAGVLDESVHPFTINISKNDVRLTTNYHEDEFTSALYSTIHEGGHGIYEQNIGDDLKDTGLQDAISMAIHESQSR
ncbi:MAG: carboxypeptidase M32, partial [Clostridium celatum]|nr:carboxypeptidase M32 [Clostridium celatum]